MSLDVQFLSLCDHFVDKKQYRPDMCPRCYGRGYYLDIVFDTAGDVVTTGGGIKLQQEVIKILLDEKLSDLFYPQWGSEIYTFIGKKNTITTKSRLEMCIRRTIEYLKQIQEQEALTNNTITDKEVIKNIEYIILEPLSVTEWRVLIVVSNKANDFYEYTMNL